MGKNYKKDAIEILKGLSSLNYKTIIYEIAKSNPYALIKAYEELISDGEEKFRYKEFNDEEKFPYVKNVKNFIKDGRFIEAIKLVRTESRCGLKEAKEFCDKIRYDNTIDMSILNIR